ncbi:M23 family metallopeptidase [Qiania dongpingensis]|uniref:M23 family metallopeptidase n=1 Tax=Qiania dongpingensis TaxID=2763669 RepID=A0A7G9G1P4_9FIRM|nr:M23 family metallopeptidase [Qiania dongpingensis]QNM04726.1 M23 family metallopeptidase [Qiania dongpingensis]
MKKKQGLLVMLLGCLVTVTAIAGVLVWRGTDKKEDENNQYMELNDSSEELLWNDEETTGTKEETSEDVKETTKTAANTPESTEATEAVREETGDEDSPEQDQMELPSEAPAAAGEVHSVSFGETDKLIWPVEGNVILDYSMDKTIYFPTLDQYKCNPAVLIQGAAGTQVKAAANAIVKAVGTNEELGNYVTLDLGNAYELTCGQLTELAVNPGDYVEAGAVIGNLAEPTKYYVVEGPNLYFQMTKDGAPIDPLDFVEYAQE